MPETINTNVSSEHSCNIVEEYETIIGNTTFTVASKYIGDKTYLDFLKAAIRRDVEMSVKRDSAIAVKQDMAVEEVNKQDIEESAETLEL